VIPVLVAGLASAPCDAVAQDSTNAWVHSIGAPQYFAVWVEDVDRAVAWYRAVFGLRELGGSEADDRSWRIENVGNEHLVVEIGVVVAARPIAFTWERTDERFASGPRSALAPRMGHR
jgi:catechol 2,3-dioxygenase-like lactoylglutathione lyase family enzyme